MFPHEDHQLQARQDRPFIFQMDETTEHPQHATYTGLAEKYPKTQLEDGVDHLPVVALVWRTNSSSLVITTLVI